MTTSRHCYETTACSQSLADFESAALRAAVARTNDYTSPVSMISESREIGTESKPRTELALELSSLLGTLQLLQLAEATFPFRKATYRAAWRRGG